MNTNNQFILSGKYEVLRTLGHGSFGTVYLVRHQSLESERAVKIIPKNSSSQLSVLSEARLLKSLKHPGIPMIYDIEEDNENYHRHKHEKVQNDKTNNSSLTMQTGGRKIIKQMDYAQKAALKPQSTTRTTYRATIKQL